MCAALPNPEVWRVHDAHTRRRTSPLGVCCVIGKPLCVVFRMALRRLATDMRSCVYMHTSAAHQQHGQTGSQATFNVLEPVHCVAFPKAPWCAEPTANTASCVHHSSRDGQSCTRSVTTGACITARTGRRSRSSAAAGSSGSHGTHFTASCPWYSECVAASPTHCAQGHCGIISRTLVASTLLCVSADTLYSFTVAQSSRIG